MKFWDGTKNNYYSEMIPNSPAKIRGLWWPAGREDLSRSGILVLKRGRHPLLLVNSWEQAPFLFSRYNRDRIFGVSHQGVPFTLFECYNTGTETFNENVGRSGYIPATVMWGGHADSIDEPFCSRIHIECPQGLDVVNRNHPCLFSTGPDGSRVISIPDSEEIIKKVTFDSKNTIKSELIWLESGGVRSDAEVKCHAFFTIFFHEKVSVSYCREMLSRLRIAIRFASCNRPDFKLIELWSDLNVLPCGLFQLEKNKKEDVNKFYYYPLREESSSIVRSAVEGIFSCNLQLCNAIIQFHQAVDTITEDMDWKFFDIARIIERLLGRHLGSGSIIDKNEHNKVIDDIILLISKISSTDYRERIARILQNANELSPRNKIKKFVREDDQAARIAPDGKNLSEFIDRIVECRNAMAHFSTFESAQISWRDLEVLIRLTDLCIWRLLGISSIPIHERYGQWADRVARDKAAGEAKGEAG